MKLSRSLSFHDQVRFLRILFFILLGGQAFYFLVAWIVKAEMPLNSSLNNVFDYVVPLILLASIFAARIVYRSLVNKAKRVVFIKKLDSFRTAVITSLAILEGANIFVITAFMLSNDYLYAAASLIMFLLFILNSPSEDKFRIDLELTPEELSHTE